MLEKVGKEWLRTEFRVNKKGAECYRTEDREEAILKLKSLQEKRPGIYTMQRRSARLDRYGCEMQPLNTHGWA